MSETRDSGGDPQQAVLPPEVRDRLQALVDALLPRDAEVASSQYEALLVSARDLLHRKLTMQGTKSETRVRLEDLLGARLHKVFGDVAGGRVNGGGGTQPAEILLGALLSGSFLADFATAVDRAILECSAPRDYSFAGRADFISLEEVLQLLGGGKHRGRLTLEKPDNRLDVYLDNSAIAFLDPHRMIRRVIPRPDRLAFREISADLLSRAEKRHAAEGQPIFLTLHQEGFFKDGELRDMMRQLGAEVLAEFLREQSDISYTYRRLDELPAFAATHNLKLPITPMLLEGSKRLDEWKGMCKVFPDPNQELQPVENLISKIGAMDINVLEIKLLAQINGKTTPRKLTASMGLPLQEVYQHLLRFAKEGVLVPPGGERALQELAMSIEESVEMAWQHLDRNDDQMAVSSALDKVLGFGEEPKSSVKAAAQPGRRLRAVHEKKG